MITWIGANIATLLVGLAVLAAVAGIIAYQMHCRRKGQSCSCGGGCSGCSGACCGQPEEK